MSLLERIVDLLVIRLAFDHVIELVIEAYKLRLFPCSRILFVLCILMSLLEVRKLLMLVVLCGG